MICPQCDGKGFVPAAFDSPPARIWDGNERRTREREVDNLARRFSEVVPAAVYHSCPRCQGAGRLFANLMNA
jgi:hypothetical protein